MDERENRVLSTYVIHSLPLNMSAVQVFIDDKMAMVGHLVGSDTIGYEEELGLNTQAALAEPWRAMLLKDDKGDVGIVVARWQGFRPGKPGVPGVKGIPGKAREKLMRE